MACEEERRGANLRWVRRASSDIRAVFNMPARRAHGHGYADFGAEAFVAHCSGMRRCECSKNGARALCQQLGTISAYSPRLTSSSTEATAMSTSTAQSRA